MTSIGFHVWNPAGRLPTHVHATFLGAWAEKDRLQGLHPDQRFVVMMPCEDMSAIGYGLGFTRGREEGYAEARREIILAENRLDTVLEQFPIKALRPFLEDAEAYQSIVADCLLWIQGFNAAYAGRESYDRPNTPSVDQLHDLNAALQFILREQAKARGLSAPNDLEIPF